MAKPRRKRTPTHERSRSQRMVNTGFIWRRSTTRDGDDNIGFIAPVPMGKRSKVLELMVYAPQHWHLVAIVYCLDAQGGSYRSFAEHRTNQRVSARDWRTEEDQLSPLLRSTLDAARDGVNPRQIVDTAMIMRP